MRLKPFVFLASFLAIFITAPAIADGGSCASILQKDAETRLHNEVPHLSYHLKMNLHQSLGSWGIEPLDKSAGSRPKAVELDNGIFLATSADKKFQLVRTGKQWGRPSIGDGISLQVNTRATITKLTQEFEPVRDALLNDKGELLQESSFQRIADRFSLVHAATRTGSHPSHDPTSKSSLSNKLARLYEMPSVYMITVHNTGAEAPSTSKRAQRIESIIFVPKYSSKSSAKTLARPASEDDADFVIPIAPGHPDFVPSSERNQKSTVEEVTTDLSNPLDLLDPGRPRVIVMETPGRPRIKVTPPAAELPGRPRINVEPSSGESGRPRIDIISDRDALFALAVRLEKGEPKFTNGDPDLPESWPANQTILVSEVLEAHKSTLEQMMADNDGNVVSVLYPGMSLEELPIMSVQNADVPGRPRIRFNPWAKELSIDEKAILSPIEKAVEFERYLWFVNSAIGSDQ